MKPTRPVRRRAGTARRRLEPRSAGPRLTKTMILHATCVVVEDVGVLLRGRPGSGKSDLALRIMDAGGRLVADDQVVLRLQGNRLVAGPPPTLAGRIEVRGIGIVAVPHEPQAAIGLVVDLVAAEAVARMPEAESCRLLGTSVPRVKLAPFTASAVAKLRIAAREHRADIMPGDEH